MDEALHQFETMVETIGCRYLLGNHHKGLEMELWVAAFRDKGISLIQVMCKPQSKSALTERSIARF